MFTKITFMKERKLMETNYAQFLQSKSHLVGSDGFAPTFYPEMAFDFQKFAIDWRCRNRRGLIGADCGLGKTLIQLSCAQNIVEHTNKKVLILAPLAVAPQTVKEGEKFGIDVEHSRDGKHTKKIVVTNYEKLHLFDPNDFVGVEGDELSCIKAFNGKRRSQVTAFMRHIDFRGGYTATPAPNDYIELGTLSEALGYLGQKDMLSMFFKSSDDKNDIDWKFGDFWNKNKWTFRAHAEKNFWRWVCSWARFFQRPSDIGFDDNGYDLPELIMNQHIVGQPWIPEGELLPRIAVGLSEQRQERNATLKERCEKVANLVSHDKPAVVWCHNNNEGDLLEKIIPDGRQIAGKTDDDEKEELFNAFSEGQLRVLITKPKIGAWGLNWQHCDHMTFFPSHSFEQFYQGVRRCWRFGQKNNVVVDIVTTRGEEGVTANLNKKKDQAQEMFASVVREMNNELKKSNIQKFEQREVLPTWL